MPARIVTGFDGTDSGEDALALGLVLARDPGRSALPLLVVPRVGHDGDAERGTGGGPAV